ncbi:CidA/LrgA family protein [Marinobacter salinexigens]|uniref:CidA/LrgA family protein n=1 Tax=Marinobacter salinexigens TaxID=2919747 RepID=A0A5B0VCR5_9GAMM|nr:CidA/LrgA family protein [Marinobacter salinexigens]KAA1172352.1 CidA/LrgA family protein [Marinobacter salinexigens]
MVLLRGFLTLVVFFLLGEAVRVLAGLPISGGVLGMVMATGTLMLRGRVSDELASASQGLIAVLVMLISPGVVGVFFIADQFSEHWLTVAVALAAGTLLSVLTTLWVMNWVAASEGKKHD